MSDEKRLTYHVAASVPEGAGAGTEADPFGRLEQARDAIRDAKRDGGLPDDGATVVLHEGRYERTSAFELAGADSGAEGAPVLYRAADDADVTLTGGVALDETSTRLAGTDSESGRLRPQAREHVRVFDVGGTGGVALGRLSSRGMAIDRETVAPELFVDGVPMTLARWPNEGFVRTGDVHEPGAVPRQGDDPDGRGAVFEFGFGGGPPTEWADPTSAWMHGYWKHDWADQTLRIANVDPNAGTIETAGPHRYGVAEGRRYVYFNVLEELDRPGEYYIDREGGRLYLFPPGPDPLSDATVELSQLAEPLIAVDGAENVRIEGLRLTATRDHGVTIADGARVELVDCTVQNTGRRGVVVTDSVESGLRRCLVRDTATGGVALGGGDRDTLTEGRNVVVDTEITRFARVERTYSPAVALSGVGNRVRYCHIHDAPHQGIFIGGNEHRIEHTEFDTLVTESNDMGAVYTGRNWTERGTVVRRNLFHDIGHDLIADHGVPQMGVYIDDRSGGVALVGNTFANVARPVYFGGRNVEVADNLVVDCPESFVVGSWGDVDRLIERLEEVPYTEDPWRSRYPELLDIAEDDPETPKYNAFRNNLLVDSGVLDFVDGVREHGVVADNAFSVADVATWNPDTGSLEFDREAVEAAIPEFQPVDPSSVGPRERPGAPTGD